MSACLIVVIASGSAERIAASAGPWGHAVVACDPTNGVFGVIGTADDGGAMVLDEATDERHPIVSAPPQTTGLWAVAGPSLHQTYWRSRRIGRAISTTAFRRCLTDIPEAAFPSEGGVVVTWDRAAKPEWAAWWYTEQSVVALDVEVLPPARFDPIHDLGPNWPIEDLDRRVVVVGVGSIGSAAAHALARYGVRDLVLVDPDRLRPHNLVRHQCTRADIGMYKVDVVRTAIIERWPEARIDARRISAIAHANSMRQILSDSAIVLCAADGVAARRCVNHFARRAGCTAVFTCVLRDGAVGEALRVWPGAGCLLCARASLVEQGAFDPEPGLDAAYGTGDAHRPMTAVGSDLTIVGEFAAKVVVSTMLEEAGHYDHVLRDDWALIGLRMDRTAPEPFDLFPGQVHWLPGVDSRACCPTCGWKPLWQAS